MKKPMITDAIIAEKAQEIAMAKMGRRITPDDVRLFSILNKAESSYNVADNRYFEESLEDILTELDSRGYISYDRGSNSIKIKRSFYEFMVKVLKESPNEYKVR
jgi:hypothetical protein